MSEQSTSGHPKVPVAIAFTIFSIAVLCVVCAALLMVVIYSSFVGTKPVPRTPALIIFPLIAVAFIAVGVFTMRGLKRRNRWALSAGRFLIGLVAFSGWFSIWTGSASPIFNMLLAVAASVLLIVLFIDDKTKDSNYTLKCNNKHVKIDFRSQQKTDYLLRIATRFTGKNSRRQTK